MDNAKRTILIPAALLLLVAGTSTALLALSSTPDEAAAPSALWSTHQIARTQGAALQCALDPAYVPLPPAGSDGQRPNYLHTCGNWILDSYGQPFRVVGITWSGMEYRTRSPLGLYTRNWREVVDQIAGLSYNTLRLPFTNDMLDPQTVPSTINYELNPDLKGLSALEVLDRLVEGARRRGLRVILDRHRPTSAGQTPLWYTDEVSEQRWIRDWQMLVRRYKANDTVIGVDLHNEPHGEATWGSGERGTDWRLAAERAGEGVLEVNPYLLVVVQGIDRYGNDLYWWGGDLRGVAEHPVRLGIPNRVVYSPRDYGPEVYPQGYFSDSRFPHNLPEIWDEHWGYIQKREIAPIVLGELGGSTLDDSLDGRWKRALLNYVEANRIGYINWALDRATFDDPSALQADTAMTILDTGRLYRASAGIPNTEVEAASSTRASSLKVLHRADDSGRRTSTIKFAIKVRNTGSRPIELSRIEIRYWFTAATSRNGGQTARARWASSSDKGLHSQGIRSQIVPASPDGDHFYLQMNFDELAGSVPSFADGNEVQVEILRNDRSAYEQSNDYSYSPNSVYQESERIALYLDRQLIWGAEP